MLIEMLTLDEKIGKASERQMASHHVSLVGCPHGKVPQPAHFKKGHRALLQSGITHRHKLSILGLSIEQEQNTVCAEVQRIGFTMG